MKDKLSRSKAFYHEEQKFSQPWIWLIFIPMVIALIVLISGASGKDFKPENNGDLVGLIVGGGILLISMLGLTWLFLAMKLITDIEAKGIRFRYPPFINKPRQIRKSEIESYAVREFKPIMEYGGYGIKSGPKRRGKSYTVSGKIGLQLVLKNGEKILIGSKRKAAIQSAMARMMIENERESN